MAKYEIEADGAKYEIDAPDENAAFAAFQSLNSGSEAPEAPKPAEMASLPEYDAMGAPTGGTMQVAAPQAPASPGPGLGEAAMRGAAQGATLSFGDEVFGLGGGVRSWQRGEGFQKGYDRAVTDYRAGDKAAREAHPYVFTGSEIAGSLPTVMAGGVPTTVRGMAALGAGVGAVSGFGAGEDNTAGRLSSAFTSGGLGAAGGVIAPYAGQAIGAGGRALARSFMAPAATVPGMSGAAAGKLAEDLGASGGVRSVADVMSRLGPEAMLLDASPSFMGRAQGLAVRPETREAITSAVTERNLGKNARLATDLDAAIGPAPIPSQVEAGLAARRTALSPEYQTVMQGAQAVDTSALAAQLEAGAINARGPAQKALRDVRSMLDVPGNAGVLDPNPQALLASRQAIDGMLAKEADSNVVRLLSQSREAIDNELARAVPGIKAVDAQYAELARQSEGLQRGGQILDSGKTAVRPAELADELVRGVNPQGEMVGPSAETFRLRQGARAEIDRQVGTKANDLVALKNVVKGDGDFNRAKLAQVFGEEEAGRIFGAVDREAAFERAYNRLVENSQTAQRNLAAEGVAVRGEKPTPSDIGPVVASAAGGVPGFMASMGFKGAGMARDAVNSAADLARNQELAGLLTSRLTPEIRTVLAALERRGAVETRAHAVGGSVDRVTRALIASQANKLQETRINPELQRVLEAFRR